MMLKEEIKRLAEEFGLLAEHIEQDVDDQISRAKKLDEVDTITFGLETDDNKIVKVFVNAKDADKFEKIMADCLGATDSIEEAINKAAGEVDIVDVEWPEDDEEDAEEEAEDDGSDALNSEVYGNEKEKDSKKTKAKKEDPGMTAENLSYGERFGQILTEDHGAISSRMSTPMMQLVYQAIIDLGVPEQVLDRSPYRSAILKGIREAAHELQSNGTAKQAVKTFIKAHLNDEKHHRDKEEPKKHEHGKVKESMITTSQEIDSSSSEVVMSEAEDGMLITQGTTEITLNLEELELTLKALTERATSLVGKVVVSPRGQGMALKPRGESVRIVMDAHKTAEFKELAAKLLGE